MEPQGTICGCGCASKVPLPQCSKIMPFNRDFDHCFCHLKCVICVGCHPPAHITSDTMQCIVAREMVEKEGGGAKAEEEHKR